MTQAAVLGAWNGLGFATEPSIFGVIPLIGSNIAIALPANDRRQERQRSGRTSADGLVEAPRHVPELSGRAGMPEARKVSYRRHLQEIDCHLVLCYVSGTSVT